MGIYRRDILKLAGGAIFNGALVTSAGAALIGPARATVAPADTGVRRLAFINTHTGDTFAGAYWEAGGLIPDALQAIRYVMRDHRSNEMHAIDPRLLDQLHALRSQLDTNAPYQIISGFRSAASNASLAAQSSGVATRSLHMEGRAIDVRVRGVDTARLRDAAIAMQAGGVGYYQSSDFIHLDTGRVRRW